MRPLLLLLSLCVLCASTSRVNVSDCAQLSAFASSALDSFVGRFVQQNGSFSSASNSSHPASYWNSFVALSMMAHATQRGLMRRDDFEQFLVALAVSYNTQGWASAFYDDMDWAVEAVVVAASVVRSPALREALTGTAVWLAAQVEGAKDKTCCGSVPGGYWWDAAQSQKACASNMGTAKALCTLARATGNSTLMREAHDAFVFWNETYVLASGQSLDHILVSGKENWDVWTYNQGMTIGAAACLDTEAGLSVARRALSFLLSNETEHDGLVLREHSPCWAQDQDCMEFKGISLRFVSLLRDTRVAPLAAANAATVARNTNAELGLPTHWSGPPAAVGSTYYISSQTSALSALIVQHQVLGCKHA